MLLLLDFVSKVVGENIGRRSRVVITFQGEDWRSLSSDIRPAFHYVAVFKGVLRISVQLLEQLCLQANHWLVFCFEFMNKVV